MATVVVINGRHRGEWYSVPESPRGLTFGRDDQLLAEVIDPRVSHQHMRIFKDPTSGTYTVEDLKSRNGTRVNGSRIEIKDLEDGDVIQIGHTLVAYTQRALEAEEEIEAFVDEMRKKSGSTLEQVEKREEYTEAAALFSRLFRRPGSDKKKKR